METGTGASPDADRGNIVAAETIDGDYAFGAGGKKQMGDRNRLGGGGPPAPITIQRSQPRAEIGRRKKRQDQFNGWENG